MNVTGRGARRRLDVEPTGCQHGGAHRHDGRQTTATSRRDCRRRSPRGTLRLSSIPCRLSPLHCRLSEEGITPVSRYHSPYARYERRSSRWPWVFAFLIVVVAAGAGVLLLGGHSADRLLEAAGLSDGATATS